MRIDGPLLLVGCGKMGGALLAGWLARGLPAQDVTLVDPQAENLTQLAERGVTLCTSADELAADFVPGLVGRGMSVLYANDNASAAQRKLCGELLAPVGEVAWIEDESQMDAVTAVSGGGPAYVFLLIECLARAGRDAGLPAELAMHLAEVTVAGSGELVRQSDEPVATLRQHVTSPGGTTLEALKVLMADDGLQPLMTRAIAAATRRSRELAD